MIAGRRKLKLVVATMDSVLHRTLVVICPTREGWSTVGIITTLCLVELPMVLLAAFKTSEMIAMRCLRLYVKMRL